MAYFKATSSNRLKIVKGGRALVTTAKDTVQVYSITAIQTLRVNGQF
jgi:hypothetical protein